MIGVGREGWDTRNENEAETKTPPPGSYHCIKGKARLWYSFSALRTLETLPLCKNCTVKHDPHKHRISPHQNLLSAFHDICQYFSYEVEIFVLHINKVTD